MTSVAASTWRERRPLRPFPDPLILSPLLDPPVLRRVEQAADAGGAVDQEARDLAAGAAPLALEQTVDGARHEADVIETVREQDLERLGHDDVVSLGDRLQRVPIE